MIKLAKGPHQLPGNSALGCKILATALAYGVEGKISTVWAGAARYCLWGDNMTIDGELADREEALAFLNALAPATIQCELQIAKRLKLHIVQQGEIMEKNLCALPKTGLEVSFSHNAKMVHELFTVAGLLSDYEGFLLDYSHKLRHSLGASALVFDQGQLCSCALSTYVTADAALITAVAAAPAKQGLGYGKQALQELERQLGGRMMFLLKEQGRNDGFYQSLGYRKTGEWAIAQMRKDC